MHDWSWPDNVPKTLIRAVILLEDRRVYMLLTSTLCTVPRGKHQHVENLKSLYCLTRISRGGGDRQSVSIKQKRYKKYGKCDAFEGSETNCGSMYTLRHCPHSTWAHTGLLPRGHRVWRVWTPPCGLEMVWSAAQACPLQSVLFCDDLSSDSNDAALIWSVLLNLNDKPAAHPDKYTTYSVSGIKRFKHQQLKSNMNSSDNLDS